VRGGSNQNIGNFEAQGQPPYQQPPYQQQYQQPPPQYPGYGPPPGAPPGPPMGPYGPPAKPQSAKPVIGGVLILLGGIIGIISWGWTLAVGTAFSFIPGLGALLMVCGIIGVVLSIIALLGGIFAIKRQKYGLALVGGICSLLVGYFILGLIGLILVAISKDEFT
jgi:hypothetical protein